VPSGLSKICYCADITIREVYESVGKGNHTIGTIREDLNKTKMGECQLKTPLGICCHKDFEILISKIISDNSEKEVCQ